MPDNFVLLVIRPCEVVSLKHGVVHKAWGSSLAKHSEMHQGSAVNVTRKPCTLLCEMVGSWIQCLWKEVMPTSKGLSQIHMFLCHWHHSVNQHVNVDCSRSSIKQRMLQFVSSSHIVTAEKFGGWHSTCCTMLHVSAKELRELVTTWVIFAFVAC